MKIIEIPNARTREAAIQWLMDQGYPLLKNHIDECVGDGWRTREIFVNTAGKHADVRHRPLMIERLIHAEIQDDDLAFEFALRFGI